MKHTPEYEARRAAVMFRASQARGAEDSLRYWMISGHLNHKDDGILLWMQQRRMVEYCCECVWYWDALKDLAAAVKL